MNNIFTNAVSGLSHIETLACIHGVFLFLKIGTEVVYMIMPVLQTPLKITCSWQAVSLVSFPNLAKKVLKFKFYKLPFGVRRRNLSSLYDWTML